MTATLDNVMRRKQEPAGQSADRHAGLEVLAVTLLGAARERTLRPRGRAR
jgi:hypothetical protein